MRKIILPVPECSSFLFTYAVSVSLIVHDKEDGYDD